MTIAVLPTAPSGALPACKFRNYCVMLTTRITKRYTLFGRRPRGARCDRRARRCRPPLPKEEQCSDQCDQAVQRHHRKYGDEGSSGLGGPDDDRRVGLGGDGRRSSALGKPHPATLSPVTIGLISDGGGSSSIGTAELVNQGATAAVATRTIRRVASRVTRSSSTPARTSRPRPAARPAPTTWSRRASSPSSSPSPGRARPRCPRSPAPASPTSRSAGHRPQSSPRRAPSTIDGGFPAYLGAEALSAKQHGYHEGRSPGGERAGRHPGRAGARRPRLQSGRRRASR